MSPGPLFPISTTVNAFLATDNAGNTTMYSFDVTVADANGNSSNCVIDVIVVGGPAVDLSVLGDTECIDTNADLTIQSSESGVVYSAYKEGIQIGSSVTGNGSDVIISVATTGFVVGNNVINFKAQSGACLADLTNTAIVVINQNPTPVGIYHQ